MSEDNRSYEDRQESAVEDFKAELEEIRSTAEGEREAAKADEGETEEEYRERIANVPGIFGDIDTTAGSNASGQDVVSSQNELATQAAAEVEARAEDGDEEAAELSNDEARRQVDIAGPQPSAEEVDEAATDNDEVSQEDNKDAATRAAGNTPGDSALDSGSGDDKGEDKPKRGRNK